MFVMRSDETKVLLPENDRRVNTPWQNLVLFARAVAQCQNDVTGVSLIIAIARFGPNGIARLNAQEMLSAMTSNAPGASMFKASERIRRNTETWLREQEYKRAFDAKCRRNRVVTVRSMASGRVKRYEVALRTAPTFYDMDVEHDYRIRSFATKQEAEAFVR